jgi:serine/threonine protein kinase
MAQYKLLEELGRGGMGVVYRALHPKLEREVAIKFLQAEQGEIDAGAIARFKREMEALIKLSHPNVIKLLDAGESEGRLYYAMELVKARDLSAILKADGPLPPDKVASILDQVLDALAHVHASGLVHRDIKLGNIMLDDSGRAIVMDFGLARKEHGTLLTREGTMVGSPAYLSPEVVRGEVAVPASDQWAVGISAYEMLAGVRPFSSKVLKELMVMILRADPVPLETHRAGLHPGFDPWIRRALAKEAGERWPDAQAAREALKAALAAPAARPSSRPTAKRPRITSSVPVATLSPAPARGHAWIAALALAALAAGAAFVLAPSRTPPAPPPSTSPTNVVSTAPSPKRPSPEELVRALTLEVRRAKLDFEWSNRVWQEMRPAIPKWHATLGTLPHLARAALEKKPEIAKPLEKAVAPLLGGALHSAFDDVAPHVSRLLTDPAVGDDLRSELLAALLRLDIVDCFHEYLGRPPPFGVIWSMRDAMKVEVAPEAEGPPASARLLWQGKRRLAIFQKKDDPSKMGMDVDLFSGDPTFADSDLGAELAFADDLSAGKSGKRYRLHLASFTREAYCLLTAPKLSAPLPVRLPKEWPISQAMWISVTLKGALAERTGKWMLHNDRFYRDGVRLAFAVKTIVAEPLP